MCKSRAVSGSMGKVSHLTPALVWQGSSDDRIDITVCSRRPSLWHTWIGISCIAAGLTLVGVGACQAQAGDVAQFYKGKTIRIFIGASAGGEYDLLGRLTAKHIGRFMPGNPSAIAVNMPGAIGLKMSNHLHTVAEQDGTALGLVNNNQPMMEVIGAPGIRFKMTDFRWVGAIAPVENMMVVRASRGVKTIDDAKRTELVVGSMGRGNLTYAFPALLNDLVGTKFKIVTGYVSGPEMSLALERGEVDARSTSWSSLLTTNTDWIRERSVNYLVQAGARSKVKELAELPSIEDLARNKEDRAVIDLIFAGSRMGRPLAAPPKIPYERLSALRNAFETMTKDPEFLRDAQKSSVEVDPVSWSTLETIVGALQSMPKTVAARAKRYFE